MKIDWEEAPSGATHAGNYFGDVEYYRPAHNEMGGEYYDPEFNSWERLCSPFKELIEREHVTSREVVQENNTKWFQYEALDRTYMLLCMLEEAYGREADGYHPGLYNKECKKLVKKASKALSQLYQAIGEWEDE